MGKSFINFKFLWVCFLAFTALTVYRQQTSSNRAVATPFKIEAVEVNRLSWDQVEIVPDYTFDYVSADFGVTSKITEEVTVFNAKGESIYTGINQRAIDIPDAELGSREPLTIKYCLTKSKKTACEETKIQASPKKLTIKPQITYPYNNRIFLGVFDLDATLMRQVYNNTDVYERVNSSFDGLKSQLKLMPKGSDVFVSFPITGNSGQFDLSEVRNYSAFKKKVQQMIYNEDLEFDFEVISNLGNTKTAYPENLLEQLEKESVPVKEPIAAVVEKPAPASVEAEAPKGVTKEEAPKVVAVPETAITPAPAAEIQKPKAKKKKAKKEKTRPAIVDLHVPFEIKYDLFETPPAPTLEAYNIAAIKMDEPEPVAEVVEEIRATEVLADALKANKTVKAEIPVPTKEEIKEAKKVKEESIDVAALAADFANKIQMNVIRMVHEDPIISKNSKIKSYKYDKKTGKLKVDLRVKWVDRWMEETYSVEGILTVSKDGKNANFRITGKNQNVIDLEEFTAQRAKPSFYLKSL